MHQAGSAYQAPRRREPDLADLLREVWAGRWAVIFGMGFGALCAFVFLMLALPHYRAEMVVAPASPMEAVQNPSVIAAYTGQNPLQPQNQSRQNFERFQTVAKGAALASLLLRSESLVAGLDADRAFKFSKFHEPWTAESLAEYIDQRVSFVPVGETALRKMRYQHADPLFATEFLKRIAVLSDGLIRHGMRNEVNKRIDYLQGELSKNLNPEHRRALTDLLMEQERLRMMVSIDQPYAASVVENAYASSVPRWPDKALVFPAFMAVGALIGFVMFSARSVRKEEVVVSQDNQDDDFSDEDDDWDLEAAQAKERLKSMRKWHRKTSDNNNERPLTGRKKRSPYSSDAAE